VMKYRKSIPDEMTDRNIKEKQTIVKRIYLERIERCPFRKCAAANMKEGLKAHCRAYTYTWNMLNDVDP